MKTTSVLFDAFPKQQYFARVQLPMDVPGQSIPEPDLAVCTKEEGLRFPFPKTAVLVIEASYSSLNHDRDKAMEYAAAGVPEYWIVDLDERCVEVYRSPVEDRSALHGKRYLPPTLVREGDSISPVMRPEVAIPVASLLP